MTVTALGMVLTLGPDIMHLVSRSISHGRVTGLISLMGTAAGFAISMTVANTGLAMVFVVRALALQQLQGRGRSLPGLLALAGAGATGRARPVRAARNRTSAEKIR
jgi:threonine/homoserine/homoserine lactone efflux protein